MQDRYIKIMLAVVAGLLAANLLQSMFSDSNASSQLFLSAAQAQTTQQPTPAAQNYAVRSLKGFTVEDLQDIVAVGDGRSFVVSNSKGFMVYQVVPSR